MRWFLLMSLVAFSAVADEAVVVEKAKVTVEYKQFDPQHLPDPAPPLHEGEAAVTVYQYGVETDRTCVTATRARHRRKGRR